MNVAELCVSCPSFHAGNKFIVFLDCHHFISLLSRLVLVYVLLYSYLPEWCSGWIIGLSQREKADMTLPLSLMVE